MTTCFFVSDLHGQFDRYDKLFEAISDERPHAVFLGGDLLPHELLVAPKRPKDSESFVDDFLAAGFLRLRQRLQRAYPSVLLILGNDDPRVQEEAILTASKQGIWQYIHNRRVELHGFDVYGYAFVPPTPFNLKDWERYDVSRYVDPGCIAPEEGSHTVLTSKSELRYATIEKDLENLVQETSLKSSIFLFHTPPYQTKLDRAALDGKMIDHVPLDIHVGSIAVKRFIERRQPTVTLHGHIHESARLTGSWQDKIGRTLAFSAAHDGPELALVRFTLEEPEAATRELL